MATLYEITEDLRALDELLVESGGDITEAEATVERWMNEIETDLVNKVDGYAALISEMKARAKARKEEADRLAKRARIDTDAAKFLSFKLKERLEAIGRGGKGDAIETNRFKVGIVGNGGKQPLDIHGDVPDDFMVVTKSPDNEAIRAALATGPLEFAILQERGTRLSIR